MRSRGWSSFMFPPPENGARSLSTDWPRADFALTAVTPPTTLRPTRMSRDESNFYPRVFALVTAGLLGIALFRILQPFIGPILWSVLLAFLLFPLNRALRRAF